MKHDARNSGPSGKWIPPPEARALARRALASAPTQSIHASIKQAEQPYFTHVGDEDCAAADHAKGRTSGAPNTSRIALAPLHPETAPPKPFWDVDWERIEADEHWRATHWRVFGAIEFTAPPRIAHGIEYRTCRPKQISKPGGILVHFGPEGARHIAGTLLQHCAGYREAPHAEDVVAALRSDRPDARQANALKDYLYEAGRQDVREAWKAGEFTLHALMSRARALFPEDAHAVPHSISPWTKRVATRT